MYVPMPCCAGNAVDERDRHAGHALDAARDNDVHRPRHHRLRGEVQRLLRGPALAVDRRLPERSPAASMPARRCARRSSPAGRSARRSRGSRPRPPRDLRRHARRPRRVTCAAKSAGCQPASLPPFRPPAVRTAATMYASGMRYTTATGRADLRGAEARARRTRRMEAFVKPQRRRRSPCARCALVSRARGVRAGARSASSRAIGSASDEPNSSSAPAISCWRRSRARASSSRAAPTSACARSTTYAVIAGRACARSRRAVSQARSSARITPGRTRSTAR